MNAADQTVPESKATDALPRLRSPSNGTVRRSIRWRRFGLYAALAVVFFLVGAVPMWVMVRETASKSDVTRRELRLTQLENQLSEATINAGRGEYEQARQTASDFFVSLEMHIKGEFQTDLSSNQRQNLRNVLVQRHETIALLARSDPAAVDRLSNLYVSYRQIMRDGQIHDGTDSHVFDQHQRGVR